MTAVVFEVPGKPATKGSVRAVRAGVVIPDNRRLKSWSTDVAWAARAAGVRPVAPGRPVEIAIAVYAPGPIMGAAEFMVATPDVDKVARAALDALNGVAFADDRQVSRLIVEKWKHGARWLVEIGVRAL